MKVTFIAFCIFAIPSMVISQESTDLANTQGKWRYTNNNLSGEWYGERHYKMNPAELQIYHNTTEKLVNYLQKQPTAQNPLGVNLNAVSRAAYENYDHAANPVKLNEKVKAEIFIPFCNLIYKNGKIDNACTEVSYIKLNTNDISSTFEPAMSFDLISDKQAMKQYKEILFRPKKLLDLGDGVFLYDGYYQNRIVVSVSDRQLWLPITNQEYTNRMLTYFNACVKEGAIPQMVIDALKSEIASIPSDLMMKPAYTNGNPQRPLTGICTMEEDSTTALCKINPAYFDPSLPRTSVQLITISIEGHADDREWGNINAHRVWEFIEGLKGSELIRLLDVN
jgi:hypothetical protein